MPKSFERRSAPSAFQEIMAVEDTSPCEVARAAATSFQALLQLFAELGVGPGTAARSWSLFSVRFLCFDDRRVLQPGQLPTGPCAVFSMFSRLSRAPRAFSQAPLAEGREETSPRRIMFIDEGDAPVAKQFQVLQRIQPVGVAGMTGDEDQFALVAPGGSI